MAGTVTYVKVEHRSRGVTKIKATWLADASGDATATVIGVGFGKLVAVAIPVNSLGAADSVGNAIFTLKDVYGTTIWSFDTDQLKFAGTTTGDTTGGAAEDLFTTSVAHGLAENDIVRFTARTGGTLPALNTNYYVIADSLAATTFRLSATLGGASIEIGATDITAATWVNVTQRVALYRRPTMVISDAAGAAISAADTAPNVNRDIEVAGKLTLTVAEGGNLGTGDIYFVIDEAGLGDNALTI